MSRIYKVAAAALCVAALCTAAPVALAAPPTAEAAAKTAAAPRAEFIDYKLGNGLRVLLLQDRSAPVVALSVTYNAGSRNERVGRTGFAHLFEHMMFQGSANVGKGEHFLLIDDNGGSMNGTTSQDRTNYFAVLPANQLDLLLYLEADRMRSLDVSQENLDNQRAVVKEEKRQSYDNQPYGHLYETVFKTTFGQGPYAHMPIGSMEDLSAASLDDVREFFRVYYAPNNAALALVGDFDIDEAKRKIERYYGAIPRQPDPAKVQVPAVTAAGERRQTLKDPLARLPLWVAAYPTVPGDHPDYYPLSVLGSILGRGRTSRLYPVLVETQTALSASASMMESRGPGLFLISSSLPAGGDIAKVEGIIESEIARIQQDGVTAEELEGAKNQARTAAVGRLQTALGRANLLSQYAIFYDSPERINTLLPRIEAVTAEDVRRVARQYLKKENRAVVIAEPAPAAEQKTQAEKGKATAQ